MQDTVGIDVSKATLDAYWLSGRQHQVFSNDPSGLKRLLRWLSKAKVALTVFEATGVYDRLLQANLAEHGVPFARVNPKQARRFAEGIGQLAKTDKVDAALLARMGSLLDLKAETPRAQNANDLKDLAAARQAFLLVHVNMHFQAADQRQNCCESTRTNSHPCFAKSTVLPTFETD